MQIESESFPGQADGGRHKVGPGKLAELLMGQGQAADSSGNADTAMGRAVLRLDEHVGGRGGGGGFTKVEGQQVLPLLARGLAQDERA